MQALQKEKERQLQRHEQVTFFTKALRTAWATSFSVFKCKKAYSVSVRAAAKDRGRESCMKNNCCQRLFHKRGKKSQQCLVVKAGDRSTRGLLWAATYSPTCQVACRIFSPRPSQTCRQQRAHCVSCAAGQAKKRKKGLASSNGPRRRRNSGRFRKVGTVVHVTTLRAALVRRRPRQRARARARFGALWPEVLVLVFKPPGAARVDQNGAHG